MPVARLQRCPPVAFDVGDRGEARHDRLRVDRRDVAGRVRAHGLEPRAEVESQPAVHRPAVLRVQRCGFDVDLRAARRLEVPHLRLTRHKARDRTAARVEHRLAGRIDGVIGREHVPGRRLRVTADARAHEVLRAALQVVGAGARRRQQARHASGNLLVVPLFRIGRVEIRRVIKEPARRRRTQRPERRVHEARARPAIVLELLTLLRVLQRGENARPHGAVVVDRKQPVRQSACHEDARIHNGRRANARGVRLLRAVVDIGARHHVGLAHAAGELQFAATVRVGAGVRDAGLRKGVRGVRGLPPAGGEEPEAILRHRPAERGFVSLPEHALVDDVVRLLERGLYNPRWVAQVLAEAAAKHVPAAAGDDVDDAAGEAAVLRRDAVGEDRRVLHGVLDVEIVRGAVDRVVDVDAVNHEDVVESVGAGNRDLADGKCIGRQAGRQFRDVDRPASHRQTIDLLFTEALAGRHRRQR